MALLWFAFFLSGMAGLSYELTWVRYLTQMFGASTPAVSATVAIFFSGLALGAALGGRWFDRHKAPFLAYAKLELAIGVVAATVPFMFAVVEFFLAHYMHRGASNPVVLMLVSALVLIAPTTLLGATFPAMAAVVKRIANPTFSTGFFYGFNTLGAVAGCLAVSFWLLPLLGQRLTTWAMASINFSIAFLFWVGFLLQRKREQGEETGHTSVGPEEQKTHSSPVLLAVDGVAEFDAKDAISKRLAWVLAAVSGFLAIGIEILWTRSLALSFPASVYVFALVLAAYLVGIGLGSVWMGATYRHRFPERRNLWLMYFLIGMGSMLTMWLFSHLMPWSIYLLNKKWVSSWNGYLGWVGGSAVVAMLPATLTMGAAFPLLVGLATTKQEESSQIAGRLYALNTIGGVLGSLFVTFLLMPTIGLSESLVLLSSGYLVLALFIAWNKALPSLMKWSTLSMVVLMGAIFSMGTYPQANPLKVRANHKMLFYRDAPSATIAVDQSKNGVRTLRVNNYYGLSNTLLNTVHMQYRLGHIPMLLHPKPKRALLIGFATGTTLASIAQHRTQADCVELHKDILGLAHYFSNVNLYIHRRKKQVRLIPEDGRRFLVRGGKPYDVIVGDLYLPRNPGVGTLYSVEHFRAVKSRLNEDGLFVAWLPLWQLGPRNMASIIRSFLQVFPQAEGWVANWTAKRAILGLVGRRSKKPMKIPSHFETRLKMWVEASFETARNPRLIVQPNMRGLSGVKKQTKTARRLLNSKQLTVWANSAPINRLEQPVIEFSAPKAMMEARLYKFPLYLQNLRQIAEIRSLSGTPWASMERGLLKRKKPPVR